VSVLKIGRGFEYGQGDVTGFLQNYVVGDCTGEIQLAVFGNTSEEWKPLLKVNFSNF
jgi:hypothetical protein